MEKLYNIQSLRGLAALAVVLAHHNALANILGIPPFEKFHYGVIGVDLFFIISGFIMMHVSQQKWGNPLNFFINRIIRIFPLYWIYSYIDGPTVKITFKLLQGKIHPNIGYFLKSFFLIPALHPVRNELYPPLLIAWTLSYEFMFYTLFSLLRIGKRSFICAKISLILIGIYLLSFLLPVETASNKFLSNSIYFEFIFGCFLGKAYQEYKNANKKILMVFASIFIMLCLLLFIKDFLLLPRCISYGLPALGVVGFSLVLERMGFSASRFMQILGDASYSIYLVHSFVMIPVGELLIKMFPLLNPYFAFFFGIALVIFCGILAYYVIERPVIFLVKLLYRNIFFIEKVMLQNFDLHNERM